MQRRHSSSKKACQCSSGGPPQNPHCEYGSPRPLHYACSLDFFCPYPAPFHASIC
jgi:hypothetical protein